MFICIFFANREFLLCDAIHNISLVSVHRLSLSGLVSQQFKKSSKFFHRLIIIIIICWKTQVTNLHA